MESDELFVLFAGIIVLLLIVHIGWTLKVRISDRLESSVSRTLTLLNSEEAVYKPISTADASEEDIAKPVDAIANYWEGLTTLLLEAYLVVALASSAAAVKVSSLSDVREFLRLQSFEPELYCALAVLGVLGMVCRCSANWCPTSPGDFDLEKLIMDSEDWLLDKWNAYFTTQLSYRALLRWRLVRQSLPMFLDMALDGMVLIALERSGDFLEVVALFVSILLPQVVGWMFLYGPGVADCWFLLRVVLLPCSSFAAYLVSFKTEWTPSTRHSLLFASSFSFVQVWETFGESWRYGYPSQGCIWLILVEGLLESPLAATFQLYITFKSDTYHRLFALAVASSILTITRAARRLDQFGSHTKGDFAWSLFVVIPRILSTVTTIAFLGCVTRPKLDSGILRFGHPLFMFLICELSMTYLLLRVSVVGTLSLSQGILVSMTTMLFGPPKFLLSFRKTRMPQLVVQLSFRCLLIMVVAYLSPSMPGELRRLLLNHFWWVVIMVLATITSVVAAAWVMPAGMITHCSPKVLESVFFEASKDRTVDPILLYLFVNIENMDATICQGVAQFQAIPATTDEGRGKWGGEFVSPDDKYFYAPPYNHDSILCFDIAKRSCTEIKVTQLTPEQASVRGKWYGFANHGDWLVSSPGDAKHVLCLNSKTLETRLLDLPDGVESAQNGKWRGITFSQAGNRKRFFAAPWKVNSILEIEMVEGSQGQCDLEVHLIKGIDLKCPRGAWGGVQALGDCLYFVPWDDTRIMVHDLVKEKTSYWDLPEKVDARDMDPAESKKWSEFTVFEGKLYAAPASATSVLVVDPDADPEHRIQMFPMAPPDIFRNVQSTNADKWHRFCVCKGKLFAAPFNALEVLVFDPRQPAGSNMFFFGNPLKCGGKEMKWNGFAAAGDDLFAAPWAVTEILHFQPTKYSWLDPMEEAASDTEDLGSVLAGREAENSYRLEGGDFSRRPHCEEYSPLLVLTKQVAAAKTSVTEPAISRRISKHPTRRTRFEGAEPGAEEAAKDFLPASRRKAEKISSLHHQLANLDLAISMGTAA